MKANIQIGSREVKVDFSTPLDISIPLCSGEKNLSAWYVPPPKIEAVITEQFTGSVKLGGSVNFRNIYFNPHGHGTHTECVGHISKEDININDCLKEFFFLANLISIEPEKLNNGDEIISLAQIEEKLNGKVAKAIVIRTMPNPESKMHKQYSNSNPPYVESAAMKYLTDLGYEHFLIDLPSVDREMDAGVLSAHHQFWEHPEKTNKKRTITELIYVADEIEDGEYLLNLQIASFENDASPSKPVLYNVLS